MSWLYLLAAGVFEIGFTTALRFSDNFTKLWPTLAFLVCASLSFSALSKATETIPLGTAYAVWTGIGAAGTAVLGIVWFGEPVTTLRIVFLLLLVGSIIGLKLAH